jgi:alkaline phosphatase
MKNLIITFFIVLSFSVCTSQSNSKEQVKNIILMIGDGMGTAEIYAAYTINKGVLNIEKAQYVGFSKTSSADNYITDSGASGTAMATGEKTYNGFISVNNDLSTGLIATSAITHATPASFICHRTSRYDSLGLAEDFLMTDIDIFIGGGRIHFEERADGMNISDSLRNNGYSIFYSLDEIKEEDKNNIGCFISDKHPSSVLNGRGDFLLDATNIALSRLKNNEKGFFIMVEGSQIDWGGHNNDISYQISEVIDFDNAVGEAMNFADNNPGTLVLVTADHETGGLALVGGNIKNGELQARYSSGDHTAVMVPVFAYGTGASEFAGIYENTELFHKMLRLYGFE